MRFDDVSQAESHGHSDTVARPDVDRLAPGSYGPATGNAITGQGTSSGASGADSVGSTPATIVAVHGAGGQAVQSNGAFQANGQYGELSIDAQGNFSYARNPGTPDGVKDVFNYTIADASGANSSTTLTIDIGQVAAAAAGQGVVSLPAGVELSDIHVNGRDLVIDMPDGTQMVIPNGAVFVPQIMIGDVEVPPTNVAALLVQSEPEPAAGPPPSSGGNWDDVVPTLAPGAPIGDLVPPTELGYTPPTFEQPAQGEDTKPTVIIETPDNPAGVVDASESVDEKGLPTRNGGEPAGSGEIADGNGSNNSDASETNGGTIVFTAKDGLDSVTINGVAVTQVGQQIAGQYGTLTITGIDLATGQITYSYTLSDNTSGDSTKDVFTVVVTDHDGDTATGTLTVNIVDDHPTALNDTDSVDLASNTATGNVITGAGTASGAAGADIVGADNASVTSISSNATGNSDSTFDANGNLVVKGEYGTLTIHADGSYTYTPDGGVPGGSTDVFTYTLTDGDGDAVTATLTITNPDHTPTVVIETPGNPALVNATESVDEKGLGAPRAGHAGESPGSGEIADGNAGNNSDKSETNTGTILFTAQDGVKSVTIDGTAVTGVGQQIQGTYGVLTITSIDLATGQIGYSYTLTDNTSGNNTKDVFSIVVTDSDGDQATGSLTVNIVDDVPTAHNDFATQAIGAPSVTVDVVANDVFGADGVTDSNVAYVNGSLTGTGTLVYNNDGTFTYTPSAGEHGTVTFEYSITDGDGDVSTATVTITLTANSIPTVSISGDQSVDEAGLPPHNGLPAGSGEQTDDGNPNDNSDKSETATGSINITTGSDTLASVVINGTDVTNGGTVTGSWGTLTVTHNADGTYSYSYTLTTNTDANTAAGNEDDFHVVVTDNNGDTAATDLNISIVDDQPTAFDDVANQTVQNQPITVDVVANDVFGADGVTNADVTYVTGSLTGTGTLVYNNDGTFTYTPSAGESGTVTFQYTITDGDGDPSTATVTINLTPDTIPTIGATSNLSVDEDGLPGANSDNGQVNPTEANHGGSATDTSGSVTVSFGADVPATPMNNIYFVNPGALDGQLTQNGQPITFGIDASGHLVGSVNGTVVITIEFTGATVGAGGDVTYTYEAILSGPVDQATADQLEAGISLTGIQFQVTDSDGSHAGAPGSFDVTIYDDVPSASDESASVAEGSVLTGTFDYVAGADGAHITAIDNTTLVYDNTGWSQTVALSNGSSIRVNIDGSYEFTPADPTSGTPTVTGTYTVTDADGDHVTANFSFGVTDAYTPTAGTTSALVDDDGLPAGNHDSAPGDDTPSSDPDNNEATFSGTLPHNFGGDGAGSISFAAMDGTTGTVGQESVKYIWNAGTNTLTAEVTSGARAGTDLFQVVVNPTTGAYTVTLLENVLQVDDGTNSENNATAALTYTVVDSDGSTANPSGTLNISFDDDVPTLGTIQPLTANDDPTQTPSVGSLHLSMGADGFAGVTISPDLTGLSSGGHALIGSQTGNVYTAYADVNNDGSIDAGDTAVFTITVDPNGGTSGTYTFDLLQALDGTITNVLIDSSSAFGAGPAQTQILSGNSGGLPLSTVSGWATGAGFSEATWLATGVASGLTEQAVNGSTVGWGVDNNSFTTGEFMRFDFSGTTDYDGPGGYTPPPTALPNAAYATFKLVGYTASDTITFMVHYTDGTYAVYTEHGNSSHNAQFTLNAPAGKFIDYIELYADSAAPGKIDLVGVGTQSTTHDITIPVDMTFTDGDGDSVPGSTTIHITDGGSSTTPNAVVQQNAVMASTSTGTSNIVAGNDNNMLDSRVFAVGHNAAVMAALAAAGLQAEELRIDAHLLTHPVTIQPVVMSPDTAPAGVAATSGTVTAAPTHIVEPISAVTGVHAPHAVGHAMEIADQLHLTGRVDAHHIAINELLHQSGGAIGATPVHATAVTAAAIAMPSAAQLVAAAAAHGPVETPAATGVQHNEVVGKVLADSLHGGEGHGPNIDALLNTHTGHAGGLHVVEALANQAPAPLHFGHVGFTTMFGGHHVETMHHDAAPPAHA